MSSTNKQTIVITVRPDGGVETRVEGGCGKGCRDLTRALRDTLGETVSDKTTPDYYAEERASDAVRVGGNGGGATVTLRVDVDGCLQFVYTEELEMDELGAMRVRRASHVEPAAPPSEGGGVVTWTADLTPVGGPVLGPFQLRSEALAAELAWLDAELERRAL